MAGRYAPDMTEASSGSHGSAPGIGRGRRIGVVVLSVLAVLFLATGSIGYWAARTALDNDVFVTRVGPLASDPAVQTALADWLTQEVLTLVDVEGYLKQSLPPPADLLAKPLSAAVEDFVNKAVRDVLASDQFAELWQRVTGDAHRAFVLAASGNDSNVSTDDQGRVVVNLIPVIGEVFESLTGASPDLVSRVTGTLENLASDPPAQAIEALENATGITLPKDFGVVVIDDGGALETVRTIVEATRVAVVALIVGFVVCTAAAVALARPRRRTGVQLLGAFAVTLAFVRQMAILVDERLTAEVRVPANQDAAEAIVGSVMEGLYQVLAVLMFAVISVAVGLWVVRRREALAAVFERRDPPPRWWMTPSPASLQIAVVALVSVLLWWFGPAVWFAIVVVVGLVAAQLVLWRAERVAPSDGDVVSGS